MKVSIFGSCVTRDAFGSGTLPPFEVVEYFARSSLASAFCSATFSDPVDVSVLSSAFQRRTVEKDLRKSAVDYFSGDLAGLVVYDAIDERFDLARASDGSLCTVSNELRGTAFDKSRYDIIRSGTEEFFDLWSLGWARLISLLDESGSRDRLLVNAAYWSHATESGEPSSTYRPSAVDRQNSFLQRMYTRMEEDLDDLQFIRHPGNELLSTSSHQWGLSPFHYVKEFYTSLLDQLGRYPSDAHLGVAADSR